MVTVLSNTRALIIDMDGVLWHGDTPMAGLVSFFDALRQSAMPFILATNNASLTQQAYVDKLAGMGVAVTAQEVLTSSMVTAHYLSQRYVPANTRVFVIGESGLRVPLVAAGFVLTDLYEVATADAPDAGAALVVCGLDRKLTWDKLATATLHLRAGATLIASNGDMTLPTELGQVCGNGPILAALEMAAGITTEVKVGKPEPFMYQQALEILGVTAAETVAIGDRLDTDILGAVNAEMRSVMVLSGTSTEADIAAVDFSPTWVLDDIQAITDSLVQRS